MKFAFLSRIPKLVSVVVLGHVALGLTLLVQPGCISLGGDGANGAEVVGAEGSAASVGQVPAPAEGSFNAPAVNTGVIVQQSGVPAENGVTRFPPMRPINTQTIATDLIEPIAAVPTLPEAEATSRTYTVAKGDTLWDIARKFGLKVNEVLEANGMAKNAIIRPGDELQLPGSATGSASTVGESALEPLPVSSTSAAAAPVAAEATASSATSSQYTVRGGDTLSGIARKTGSTVKALQQANNLRGTLIRVGQVLQVPAADGSSVSGAAPAASSAAVTQPGINPDGYRTHTVRRGETIGGIARRYGLDVGDLMNRNNLVDPRALRAGAVLLLDKTDAAATEAAEEASAEGQSAGGSASQPSTETGTTQGFGDAFINIDAIPVVEVSTEG